MPSSGMSCHVGLVRINVSEERIASIFRIDRISELGTLAVTSELLPANVVPRTLILSTWKRVVISSYVTLVLTRHT
jgi:hypothetical protein